MKSLGIAFLFLFGLSLNAQKSEEVQVKSVIVDFFNAFHKQDTTVLKSLVIEKMILQSVSKDTTGEVVLKENDFNQFIKRIASIPNDQKFEEKILDYTIQIDGEMANVWTPYEFWYQEKFSHCGVNSFQLIKSAGQWKIIYLVDTRRREGCGN